jgi:hypothetical protein
MTIFTVWLFLLASFPNRPRPRRRSRPRPLVPGKSGFGTKKPQSTEPTGHPIHVLEVEDENDDEDENDWGSGGRELRPTIAVIVCIKAIDPLLRVGSHNILVVVNQGPSHDA